ACGVRLLAGRHPAGDRQRQRGGTEGRVRRRVPVLHHRGERPTRRRRSLPNAGDCVPQPESRDAARRGRRDRWAGERQGFGLVRQPAAVVIDIRRQPGANVVQTVKNIQAELPRLRRILPVGAKLTVVQDRTDTIRASIRDVQFTLVLAVALVVLVVLIFLRTIQATIIAGVALPLSLIATFCVMWFAGFSLDNLSLMALTIGTGFVVDDAIVMIENIVRHMEEGESAYDAAMRGAREIGFTIISLTVSLIAVFIPLLFMTGLVGRMFREFALTLTIAVLVSAIVSLTLTPMMCAMLLRH